MAQRAGEVSEPFEIRAVPHPSLDAPHVEEEDSQDGKEDSEADPAMLAEYL